MGLTTKQKEVFEFITNYIKNSGLAPTQREIKDHFDFKSFGSVQRYLKYLTDASLIELDSNARRGISLVPKLEAELPLLGNIAAGDPILALENPTETIAVPEHMIYKPGHHFALRIAGDSMIDLGILDNDIVICRKTNGVENGQIAVCVVNGDATLKKFYQHSEYVELVPANPNYSPIKVSKDDNFAIVGALSGLLRTY